MTIIWNENIVYFFNWEKKNLFLTNKAFLYLIFINKLWYHPKITYENIVQKDMNKFHLYSYYISTVVFSLHGIVPELLKTYFHVQAILHAT